MLLATPPAYLDVPPRTFMVFVVESCAAFAAIWSCMRDAYIPFMDATRFCSEAVKLEICELKALFIVFLSCWKVSTLLVSPFFMKYPDEESKVYPCDTSMPAA